MIRFACPGCSATFTVGDEKAGKHGKCPKCQSQFVIPAAGSGEPGPGDSDPVGPPVELSSAVPPPLPPLREPPPPPSADDPVEIQPCPKCQSRLSVMPGDLGLDIECPNCQTVYKAVRGDAPPPPKGSGVRSRTGGGLVKLGSGSDNTDDEDDRRSKRRSSRRRDDEDDDRRGHGRRDDDDDRRSRRRRDDDDRDRRYRPRYADDYGGRRLEPHRGGMILVFGILSWAVCLIFGIMAWTMGSADIKAMDEGRMDPEGRGLTRAGQIIGMIHCLLSIIAIVFVCGFAVLGAGRGR